ncbi:GHKL domain-containing protein [Kriegella sp. EG-1]|nr:GHKL domain-containing protein [Flavobacteriaceae bacterium EG-1]
MHKLLVRQIRKYLPTQWVEQESLANFLEAISKSYSDNDSKLEVLQRSTIISSQELSEANEILKQRADSQKKVIESLERSIASLNKDTNTDTDTTFNSKENLSFDPLVLAKKLEEQSSEIHRISEEKDLLLKNLEERNEALNNYAHMVSHDLKSPMRNISFLIDCIKEDDIDNFSDQTKDNCMIISENLEKMDALVDGILKHATITNLEEKKVLIDVKELLDELVQTMYVPDNIKIEYSDTLPTLLIGKYKLEQLFKNLILNAISATEKNPNGLIKIEANELKEDWEFCVSDNGKGIAEKYQQDIFKMFKKLENDFKATGIGLALVKKIVNSFHGEVWLDSKEGKGATFFFTIKK